MVLSLEKFRRAPIDCLNAGGNFPSRGRKPGRSASMIPATRQRQYHGAEQGEDGAPEQVHVKAERVLDVNRRPGREAVDDEDQAEEEEQQAQREANIKMHAGKGSAITRR